MPKVLITGGAGFIGTHLSERLASDHEIVLLDSFRRDALAAAPQVRNLPNLSVLNADIRDATSLAGVCHDVDIVIHLAAIAGVSSYYQESVTTLKTNILGTVNVLDELVKQKVGKLIYFSTSEIYGPQALNVDETMPAVIGSALDRRWVYATSKLAGEQLCMRYSEQFDFSCTIVRPFNIYGPRQVGEGAISNFCRAAAAGEPLKIYGDGSDVRAWCYVSDLVDAVEAILHTPSAAGRIFNVGNPSAIDTTAGLAQRIKKLAPAATIHYEQSGHSQVKERCPAINLASKILGYKPAVGLDEGLKLTLEWFRMCHERIKA